MMAAQSNNSLEFLPAKPLMRWHSQDLSPLFVACFHEYQTELVGGAAEPLYTPWQHNQPAKIYYTRDYYRSALHEIAHWCIAGAARRKLEDYGYWYAPEGRNAEQQLQFESVEVRPQALELLFCAAVGHDFFVSCDNFTVQGDEESFQKSVWAEAQRMLEGAIPPRGLMWVQALQQAYGVEQVDSHQLKKVWRH